VRDTAAFFAGAERYFRNPHLPEMGYVQPGLKKRLKILFFENIAEGKLGHQDADTRASQQHTARLLESLGHQVEQIPFPFEIEPISANFLDYYGLLAYSLTHFGRFILGGAPDKKKLEPFTIGLSRRFGRNILRVSGSIKKLKAHGVQMEKLFDNYDLVATPVLAHAIPPIGYFSIDLPYEEILHRVLAFACFTGIQNITGSPAISLPLSTDSHGLPIGIHFCAPFGQEKLLLELAYELEEAQPFRRIYE
jgi:amidase